MKITHTNELIMSSIEKSDSFDQAISTVWKIVDRNLPYPASMVVRAEARIDDMAGIAEEFDKAVGNFASKMAYLIEERTGIGFSESDMSLLRLAIYHEAMCAQMECVRSTELARTADRSPSLASALVAAMFKENNHE